MFFLIILITAMKCPTKVDGRGRVDIVSNDFGYCDPNCPFDNGRGFLQTTTTTARPTRRSTRPTTRRSTLPIRTTTTPRTTAPPTQFFPREESESESGLWLPQKESLECGIALDTGFIVGGSTAKAGEFPFLVLLGYANPEQRSQAILYKCGGTLLNRRYVLTAAHCHDPLNNIRVVEVVVGEYNVVEDPDCNGCPRAQRFKPEEVIRHEDYAIVDNDIALIRLDRLVVTANEDPDVPVLPVCLPARPDERKVDEFIVAGWGKTDNEFTLSDFQKLGVASKLPQKLKVPLFDLERCGQQIPGVGKNHICAGGILNEDSCNGDSGGPLLDFGGQDYPMTIFGIVSSGSRICGTGLPGVYTRVDSYLDWIKDHLRP